MRICVYIAFARSVRVMCKPLEPSVLPLIPSILEMVGDYKSTEASVTKAPSLRRHFNIRLFAATKFSVSSIMNFAKSGTKRLRGS